MVCTPIFQSSSSIRESVDLQLADALSARSDDASRASPHSNILRRLPENGLYRPSRSLKKDFHGLLPLFYLPEGEKIKERSQFLSGLENDYRRSDSTSTFSTPC
jgi:hypothetical protein